MAQAALPMAPQPIWIRWAWLLPLALLPAVAALTGEPASWSVPWVAPLGIRLGFAGDGLARLFLLLVCAVGAAVLAYAPGYLRGHARLGQLNGRAAGGGVAMKRLAAGLRILWHLFASVARSGWQISWRILRSRRGLVPGFAPGFIEYRFRPMGPGATTVLACLICLTPGSTAVDVDAAAGRMRLHLLDAGEGAGEAALREIRVLFEDTVRVLFAQEGTP